MYYSVSIIYDDDDDDDDDDDYDDYDDYVGISTASCRG